MATEALFLNLNEQIPSQTLHPSAQPPSSTIPEGEDKVREGAAPVVPKGLVAGNSDVRRKIRRAERFGVSVQLSESEKRNSRAERFGTAPASQRVDAPKKSEGSNASKKAEEMKRKARAERFGLPVPPEAADEETKKKARVARFTPPVKVDVVEEDKRKARALRFSEAPSSSPPEAIGKLNLEPEAAIAGKATGGA